MTAIVEVDIRFRGGGMVKYLPVSSRRIVRFTDRKCALHARAKKLEAVRHAIGELIKSRRLGIGNDLIKKARYAVLASRERALQARLEKRTEQQLRRSLKDQKNVLIFDRDEGKDGAFRPITPMETAELEEVLDSSKRFLDEDYLQLSPLYITHHESFMLS